MFKTSKATVAVRMSHKPKKRRDRLVVFVILAASVST
jgi:hypothetical protein